MCEIISERVVRYETIAQTSDANGIDPPVSWAENNVVPWLLDHAKALLATQDVSSTNDLFGQGFDR